MRDSAHLRRVVALACRRLTITPEELYEELKANGDLADLESGAVSVKALRQVAMTLGAMRAQESSPRWRSQLPGYSPPILQDHQLSHLGAVWVPLMIQVVTPFNVILAYC